MSKLHKKNRKKLSRGQMKIAKQTPPFDQITKTDFDKLNKK